MITAPTSPSSLESQITQGNTQAAPGITLAHVSHRFLTPDGNCLLGILSPSWVKLSLSLQPHQACTEALSSPQQSLRLTAALWPFPGLSFPILIFFIFIFLVLSLYCYQPISLHPHAYMLSHVTPWTAARQAPLSMDFSKQEYWSGLPFPSPSFPIFKMRLIGLDDMRHLPVLSPGPLEGRMHGNDVLCSK